MRYNRTKTDSSGNFERRLQETIDSELEPEMISPQTAGSEELDYDQNFTLIDQFKQTNMKPRFRGRTSSQDQSGNR